VRPPRISALLRRKSNPRKVWRKAERKKEMRTQKKSTSPYERSARKRGMRSDQTREGRAVGQPRGAGSSTDPAGPRGRQPGIPRTDLLQNANGRLYDEGRSCEVNGEDPGRHIAKSLKKTSQ